MLVFLFIIGTICRYARLFFYQKNESAFLITIIINKSIKKIEYEKKVTFFVSIEWGGFLIKMNNTIIDQKTKRTNQPEINAI